MTESLMDLSNPNEARARLGFQLNGVAAGLGLGEQNGVRFVGTLTQNHEPMSQLQRNHASYLSGLDGIRGDARLTDAERLDRAVDLFENHAAQHAQHVEELAARVSERREALDRQLFGAPAVDYRPLTGDTAAAAEAHRSGFREAVLGLAGADEARLTEALELGRLTGDRTLLRAARVVAERQGLDDAVGRSVAYDDEPTQRAYAEKKLLPTDAVLGAISDAYRPGRASLTQLQPSSETRKAAEAEDAARRAAATRRS